MVIFVLNCNETAINFLCIVCVCMNRYSLKNNIYYELRYNYQFHLFILKIKCRHTLDLSTLTQKIANIVSNNIYFV